MDGRGYEGDGGVGPTLVSYLHDGGAAGAPAATTVGAGEAKKLVAAAVGAALPVAGGGEKGLTRGL